MNKKAICVGSMTQAARAKKILASYGIAATVRKSDCGGSRAGCSFELSAVASDLDRAAALLSQSGIKLL